MCPLEIWWGILAGRRQGGGLAADCRAKVLWHRVRRRLGRRRATKLTWCKEARWVDQKVGSPLIAKGKTGPAHGLQLLLDDDGFAREHGTRVLASEFEKVVIKSFLGSFKSRLPARPPSIITISTEWQLQRWNN